MDKEILYNTVSKRKSIRKYDMTPLDESTLEKVRDFLNGVLRFDSTISTEFKILSHSEVKSIYAVKAPHYIILTSEEKEGYLINAGFIMEQADLFLSSIGLGACWLGMAKPDKHTADVNGQKFVVMLAFGKPAEKLYREEISKYKRKNISEIVNFDEYRKVMETVRLSPSAVNSQPWFFTYNEKMINAYCIKPGFIKGIIYEKMNKMDMGIALSILWLALAHEGKNAEFIKKDSAQKIAPEGYYYISSVVLS